MHNTFARAARDYYDIGLVPVALQRNGKAPIAKRWPTRSSLKLLRQFDSHAGNLALRLGKQPDGRSLIVIDVDTKRGGTLERLTQNRQFPRTATTLTASGGYHYWLSSPSNCTIRSRIDLITGVDLLGQGSLAVAEPSTINGKEYCWLEHPRSGIAPAPAWLLEDLRRGCLLQKAMNRPGRAQNGQQARHGQARPQGSFRAKEGPGRAGSRPPVRHGPLLASALRRFPVSGHGQRNRQLHRMVCGLVCRGIAPNIVRGVALGWWEHWHSHGLCQDPPDPRQVGSHVSSALRAHSRGRISAPAMLDPESIQAARSVAASLPL